MKRFRPLNDTYSAAVRSVTRKQIEEAQAKFSSREEWAVKDPLTYEAVLMAPGDPQFRFSKVRKR